MNEIPINQETLSELNVFILPISGKDKNSNGLSEVKIVCILHIQRELKELIVCLVEL